MAKTMTLLPVSKEVSDAILAGRHPLTEDWNQPGYLARDEWDRLGSNLEGVVTERAKVEVEVAQSARNAALGQIEDAQNALKDLQAKHDSVLAGIERIQKEQYDVSVERNEAQAKVIELETLLRGVRQELENIKAGPSA